MQLKEPKVVDRATRRRNEAQEQKAEHIRRLQELQERAAQQKENIKAAQKITVWDFVSLFGQLILILLSPLAILGVATILHGVYFSGYHQNFEADFVAPAVVELAQQHAQDAASSDFAERLCSRDPLPGASSPPSPWRNNGGNVESFPSKTALLFSENQIIDVVKACGETHMRVKVVGGGYSLSGLATMDRGIMVSLDRMNNVVKVDKEGKTIEVEAGMRFDKLHSVLEENGLALSVSVGEERISVGGAISTNSHGIGTKHQALSSLVTQLRIVDGSGKVHVCKYKGDKVLNEQNIDSLDESGDYDDEDEELERRQTEAKLCKIARGGGLGMMGIITSVTFKCVSSFNLMKYESEMLDVNHFLGQLDGLKASNPYLYWYWVPYADKVRYVVMKKTNETAVDNSSWKKWFDKEVVHFYDALSGWEAIMPRFTPLLHRGAVKIAFPFNLTAESHHNFRLPLPPQLTFSMEYFFPAEECVKVFRKLREFLTYRHSVIINAAVSVSYIKGDSIPLSPYNGRGDVCGIDIFLSRSKVRASALAQLHDVLMSYNGRPHFGKNHLLKAAEMVQLIPSLSEILEVRKKIDPKGLFLNDHISELFGLD